MLQRKPYFRGMSRIFLILGGLGLLIWFLMQQFPGALDGTQSQMNLAQSVLLVALIGSSLASRQLPLNETLKYAVIWIAILVVIVFGYSYRDAIRNSRIVTELLPSHARQLADGSLELQAGENGHFFVQAKVNGTPVRFLLDTGASEIVLSPADADRAGYKNESLTFDRAYQTANGVGGGARITIQSLKIAEMELHDLPASVNATAMTESLLGMTFLQQFRSYRVEGTKLTLVP